MKSSPAEVTHYFKSFITVVEWCWTSGYGQIFHFDIVNFRGLILCNLHSSHMLLMTYNHVIWSSFCFFCIFSLGRCYAYYFALILRTWWQLASTAHNHNSAKRKHAPIRWLCCHLNWWHHCLKSSFRPLLTLCLHIISGTDDSKWAIGTYRNMQSLSSMTKVAKFCYHVNRIRQDWTSQDNKFALWWMLPHPIPTHSSMSPIQRY